MDRTWSRRDAWVHLTGMGDRGGVCGSKTGLDKLEGEGDNSDPQAMMWKIIILITGISFLEGVGVMLLPTLTVQEGPRDKEEVKELKTCSPPPTEGGLTV